MGNLPRIQLGDFRIIDKIDNPSHVKSIYEDRYRELINRLVEHRKTIGMTQTELAERLGWIQSDVSKTERFVRRLDLAETLRFCEVLGLRIEELVKESD
jgi:HTH-type transcriptional regulator/antitoxin HipB